MSEQEKTDEIQPGISKEQKIGLFLLFVFAVLAVGLGALQLRNTIYGPFALKDTVPNISSEDINSVEAQQLRDTDRDGLSDFDELYVYSTSIYLADTDSDGLTDKEEVDSNKNPLCVEGSVCGGIADADTEADKNVSSTLKILGVSEDLGETPVDLTAAMSDPTQIRSMLAGVGVEQDVLNSFSDSELLQLVNEIMAVSSTLNVDTTTISNITKTTTTKE